MTDMSYVLAIVVISCVVSAIISGYIGYYKMRGTKTSRIFKVCIIMAAIVVAGFIFGDYMKDWFVM